MLIEILDVKVIEDDSWTKELQFLCANSTKRNSTFVSESIIMVSTRNVMDQQVDDLRMRMRLLQQDRRANVELLEANKASNVEEIKLLREENKRLRLRLTQLQNSLSSDKNGTNELGNLQREALKLRTEFDSLKMTSIKHRDQMSMLKDEAKTCELEAVRPTQEDGPIARKIRMLENK